MPSKSEGTLFPAFPASRPPALQITTEPLSTVDVTSPRVRRISFPALQTPSLPTSVTFTEPIRPSLSPTTPTSGHGVSAGRFSISGVLGYSRTTSTGSAASNLARLAEGFPVSPRMPVTGSLTRSGRSSERPQSFHAESPISPRIRVDSTPLLGKYDPARRRSEDWSGRPWRMGEGPGAAEALGEFGAGVKKKESEELLDAGGGSSVNFASISGSLKRSGRARSGSTSRDSRLFGSGSEASEEDEGWGMEVEGMRVGEVSALTGEGNSCVVA